MTREEFEIKWSIDSQQMHDDLNALLSAKYNEGYMDGGKFGYVEGHKDAIKLLNDVLPTIEEQMKNGDRISAP